MFQGRRVFDAARADMLDEDELAPLYENDKELLIDYLKEAYNEIPNQVSTLREIAVKNISKNIEYWISDMPEDSCKYLYILTPFDCLSTQDTLDILNQILDSGYNAKQYLNLFLHQRLTKFDLSVITAQKRSTTFKLLLQRCKRIKDLIIPNSAKYAISAKKLLEIPKEFPKLECIKIQQLALPLIDELIKLLVYHCKSLKSLEINGGVVAKDTFTLLADCLQLQKLTFHKQDYMDSDVLDKILQLPTLYSLTLISSNLRFQFLPKDMRYGNLIELNISSSHITSQGLRRLVNTMPNIQSLNIASCQHLTVECFDVISKLDKLSALNAAYIQSFGFDFAENIEIFLIKQGLKLKKLNISGISTLNTSIIAKCCPNIEELILNDCILPFVSWVDKNELLNTFAYKHLIPIDKEHYSMFEICHLLKTFSFSCDLLDVEELPMLFEGNSNSIKSLKLTLYQSYENIFFKTFFNKFSFKNLDKLDVSSNIAISRTEVYMILRNHPFLKELNLSCCGFLENEIEDIKYIINKSKSNIKINW